MRTTDDLLSRIRGEFMEMPGLRLTRDQVQRLCGVEQALCRLMLDSLVETNFLRMSEDGYYVRYQDGLDRASARRPQPAHAVLKSSSRVGKAS